jgi:hypothetical protein
VTRRSSFSGVVGRDKLSAAFLGLPEVGLVGLKDACYVLGLVPNNRLKEAVSPSERGAYSYPHLFGRLSDGPAIFQALPVLEKLFFRVKVGQRRVCRGVECPRAVLAAIALDSSADSIFGVLEAIAVWTANPGHRSVKGTQRVGMLMQAVCRRPQVGKLFGAETWQVGQEIFELRGAHTQFSSENLKNSTKSIPIANRALNVQYSINKLTERLDLP